MGGAAQRPNWCFMVSATVSDAARVGTPPPGHAGDVGLTWDVHAVDGEGGKACRSRRRKGACRRRR